jgi:hypothetical protein
MDSSRQSHANSRHVFGLLFAGYFLFILYPILRANRPCNDDLARMLTGSYSWNVNGRPLTTLLMQLLELKLPALVDAAPFPQILAIALLALAGVLVARRYAIHSPWLAVLLTLPLGAQPFFLENLSFRFDAPAMALSLLLALLPITTFRRTTLGFWLGALSLLGCLCSYQPSLNVFLIFALLDWVAGQAEGLEPRQLGRLVLRYAGQMLVALVVYEWRVAPTIKEWVQEHSQTIHSIHEFGVVVANAKAMSAYILDAMAHRWMNVLAWLMLLAAIPPMFIGLRYAFASPAIRTRSHWITAGLTILAILVPGIAVICLAGPMLLLVSPIIMPRVFPSIGALISAGLIALYLATSPARSRWPAYLTFTASGIWALSMLAFAGIYGSAVYDQQRYETRIAAQLSDDLSELRAKSGIRRFLMDGSAGFSPLTAHAAGSFHLLNTLILPYLSERDFNSRNFMKHYETDLDEARQDPANGAVADALLARACDTPALYTRNRYALRLVGDTAVVTFPGGYPASCDVTRPVP